MGLLTVDHFVSFKSRPLYVPSKDILYVSYPVPFYMPLITDNNNSPIPLKAIFICLYQSSPMCPLTVDHFMCL